MDNGDLRAQFQQLRELERAPITAPGLGVFRQLFVPVFLLLLLAPWVGITGTLQLGGKATQTTMLTVVALAMLGTWLAEQLYPRVPGWNARPLSAGPGGRAQLARDLFYLLAVTRATAFLVEAADPVLGAASASAGLPSLWPSQAPFAVRAALAFVVIEFFAYWLHRAAHHSRVLWQFHSTHHVITELGALKAVRTHPVDNLLFHLARTTPLLLLGAGPEELTAAIYFGALLGILAHANLQLSEGALGWLVNFPRWHAVHHSSDLEESRSNFGCHTVLWDRVFRTFRKDPGQGLEIGVQPVGPRSLWRELAWPFYRWVTPRTRPPPARASHVPAPPPPAAAAG
ncbi:MAG: sterol desaturase family protein [Myxococcota bacterium]|nr:sterol desaturase family protein [Myxococcota bacterium]